MIAAAAAASAATATVTQVLHSKVFQNVSHHITTTTPLLPLADSLYPTVSLGTLAVVFTSVDVLNENLLYHIFLEGYIILLLEEKKEKHVSHYFTVSALW